MRIKPAWFAEIKKGHSARNRAPFFGVGVLKKKAKNLFKDGSILDDGVADTLTPTPYFKF
jgi:hypothetical protein